MNGVRDSVRGLASVVVVGFVVVAAGFVSPPAARSEPGGAGPKAKRELVSVGLPRAAAGAVRMRVQTRRSLEKSSVTVNGRRVRIHLRPRAGQRTVAVLGATHRLHFGRNVIVVRAAAGGRRQTVRRVVRVRRGAPLVGMRAARGRQGEPMRLDGRATRPARGGKLAYRWRVVDGPADASARLRNPRAPQPRLVASHPGSYHVALTVTERGSAREARAAGGCAEGADQSLPATPMPPALTDLGPIASTPLEKLNEGALEIVEPVSAEKPEPVAPSPSPPPGQTGPGCTTQFQTIDVLPLTGPIGVAFDSMATFIGGDGQQHEGVRIGTSLYEVPEGETYAIFFDPQTRGYVGAVVVPSYITDAEEYATDLGQAMAIDRNLLLVLVSPSTSIVKRVGVADQGAFDENKIWNQNLELGDGTGPPEQAGRLQGWLQSSLVLSGGLPNYDLVLPDRIPVDTQVDQTPTSNTIEVGEARYTSTLPPGTTAGFQVLVLDPALRPQLGTPAVFGTNGTGAGVAEAEDHLAGLLRDATNVSAATVIVQSIGAPKPSTPYSVNVGQQIERLGGSEWFFLGLDGSGGYSLIGNPPPLGDLADPTASPEAGSHWTGGADGQRGLLERRGDGAFESTLADSMLGGSEDTPDYTFQPVVFQESTPWPVTDTPGTEAAALYIATTLRIPTHGPGLCAPVPQPDVRATYCNENLDFGSLAGQVNDVTYPGGDPGFTADEFVAVQKQLNDELEMVATVQKTMSNASKELVAAMSATSNLATDAAEDVINSIPASTGIAASGELGIASSVLWAASLPEGGEGIGFVASVFDLASDLTEDDGVPSPDWAIETRAADIGSVIQNRLVEAIGTINQYADILVSDYGKLAAANSNVLGPWGASGNTNDAEIGALITGVKGWLYTAIVPSAYDLVRIIGATPDNVTDVNCAYTSNNFTWYPWPHAHPQSTFFPLNDWGGSRPVAAQMMAMLHGKVTSRGSPAVPDNASGDTLMQTMFDSAADGYAGLIAPWFYDRANWTVQRPEMAPNPARPKYGQCLIDP